MSLASFLSLDLERVLATVLKALLPGPIEWIAVAAAYLIPGTIELVSELRRRDDLKGAEKMAHVVREVGGMLDEGLDEVPVWGTLLSEDQRDRIIQGLAEFVLFATRAADASSEPPDRTRMRRKLSAAAKARGLRRDPDARVVLASAAVSS